MQPRRATLPDAYEPKLRAALERRGYSLDEPAKLAQAVLKLSDFYLNNPAGATPWHEPWVQVASLVYFFPLNYARSSLVARELTRLGFFENLELMTDDGAGMGSAIHAFSDQFATTASSPPIKWKALDVSSDALKMLNELNIGPTRVVTQSVTGSIREPSQKEKAGLVASYVFTELKDIPRDWLSFEALVIIEPSTRDDARRLQAERKTLMAAGFELWAPCPHQDDCPLLIHGDKDWCHDRVHFDAPAWFSSIEKHLPMKNRTLTFSYLAARKSAPPVIARNMKSDARELVRLVGDHLDEKGKSRQAVCRSSEKEFLAWFPQRFKAGTFEKEGLEMSRGSLVDLARGLEKKQMEVRVKTPDQFRELATDERLADS